MYVTVSETVPTLSTERTGATLSWAPQLREPGREPGGS